jgi:hypothetical protein
VGRAHARRTSPEWAVAHANPRIESSEDLNAATTLRGVPHLDNFARNGDLRIFTAFARLIIRPGPSITPRQAELAPYSLLLQPPHFRRSNTMIRSFTSKQRNRPRR